MSIRALGTIKFLYKIPQLFHQEKMWLKSVIDWRLIKSSPRIIGACDLSNTNEQFPKNYWGIAFYCTLMNWTTGIAGLEIYGTPGIHWTLVKSSWRFVSLVIHWIKMKSSQRIIGCLNDYIMAWTDFVYYWPFVRGIHQLLVDSPHKGPVMQSFNIFFDIEQTVELSVIQTVIMSLILWQFESLAIQLFVHYITVINSLTLMNSFMWNCRVSYLSNTNQNFGHQLW